MIIRQKVNNQNITVDTLTGDIKDLNGKYLGNVYETK